MTNAVERTACRALLRAARSADRQPACLVGVIGQPPRRFDVRQGRPMRMQRSHAPFVEDAIWAMCGKSTEYSHPTGATAAANAVRAHFRSSKALGRMNSYESEARELQRRLLGARAAAVSVGAIDATPDSVAGVHKQSSVAAASVSSTLHRLPPSSTEKVLVGDLLITHPVSCIFQSVFDQAVVLLDAPTGVDDFPPSNAGVSGIVLNKPTGASLFGMLERWRNEEDREWVNSLALGPLLQCRLFRGGPVISANALRESLRWLHPHGEGLEGARQVSQSLWLGGDLASVAARARDDVSSVRFFLGYSAWSPVQLRIELESGVWVRARVPSDRDVKDDAQSLVRQLCLGETERADSWRIALQGVGMASLAEFPRTAGTDRRLRRYVESCQKALAVGPSQAGHDVSFAAAGDHGASEQQTPTMPAMSDASSIVNSEAGRRSNIRRRQLSLMGSRRRDK